MTTERSGERPVLSVAEGSRTTYRVKTLDGWRSGKGRYRDFDTLDAANRHAMEASMIRDGTFYCVARMEGDTPVEEAFAVKGVLFHVKSGGVV